MPAPFTCPRCHATSHHPADAEHGYCGKCHDFTGPPSSRNMRVVEGGGLKLLTADPIMIAAVRRCAELSDQLAREKATFQVARRSLSTLQEEFRAIRRRLRLAGRPTRLAERRAQ